MHFNKVCAESDWKDPEFQSVLTRKFHLPEKVLIQPERKHWEWGMSYLALKKYGYLTDDKVALGLGSGHEAFLFALTKDIGTVVATDIYGQGKFSKLESDAGMLKNPAQFFPYPFNANKLLVVEMDATKNSFADKQFDILFSFSSLEHFGNNRKIIQTMQHAYRVLKPGGIFCLAVDYIFQGPSLHRSLRPWKAGEFFTRRDVEKLVIASAPWVLRETVDYNVDMKDIHNIFDTVRNRNSTGPYPHIHLRFFNYLFSSLLLILTREK